MSLLAEIRRRNVARVGVAYLVAAWLVVQVAGTLFPLFGFDATPARIVVIVLAIGFLPALVFAWLFELTPDGLKREKNVDRSQPVNPRIGKQLDRIIMIVLTLALGYFAFDKFVLTPRREAALEQQKSEAVAIAREEGRAEALVESYGDKSIAVLPFANMSSDPEQEYFSDGISEELLNLLARVPNLRVISRVSAFSFKHQNLEMPEIARRLNVAHILEGSVRKSGDSVRITAQLIDARSDTHLWSHTWDRTLDDVFRVQDEIAAAVVEQLELTLLAAPPKADVTDPKAHALYLQARHLALQSTREGFGQAIALYERALEIDPAYAAAWNGLATVYLTQVNHGLRPIDDGFRLAREAANRALASDPDYAPAHANLGWISRSYDRDLVAAARNYEHALALEPANTDIIGGAAILARGLGRPDTAVVLDEYVVAHDPVDATSYFNLAASYHSVGRMDDSIENLRTALRLSPGRIGVHYGIAVELMRKGENAAALTEIEQEVEEGWRLIALPMIYHALGRSAESDASLAELISKYEKDSACNIAWVFAVRGESDRAFEWLNKAVEYNDPGLAEVAVEPFLSSLHDDPRWLPFLRLLGRAPEQLATITFDVTLPR